MGERKFCWCFRRFSKGVTTACLLKATRTLSLFEVVAKVHANDCLHVELDLLASFAPITNPGPETIHG